MSEEQKYLDPSAFGFFLVAVISLPLAMLNLLKPTNYNEPLDALFFFAGLLMILTAIYAWKCKAQFGFVVFGLVGLAVILSSGFKGCTMGPWANLVFALIFAFSIAWSVIIGTGKNLTLLLVTTTLIFLFIGLKGVLASTDDFWGYLIGIAALLNFLLNMYMACSCAVPEKIRPF